MDRLAEIKLRRINGKRLDEDEQDWLIARVEELTSLDRRVRQKAMAQAYDRAAQVVLDAADTLWTAKDHKEVCNRIAAAILALKHPDVREALERFRREQSQA